jgi:hypothetical protein
MFGFPSVADFGFRRNMIYSLAPLHGDAATRGVIRSR